MIDIPLLIRDLVIFLLVALIVNLISGKTLGSLHFGSGDRGSVHWFVRTGS